LDAVVRQMNGFVSHTMDLPILLSNEIEQLTVREAVSRCGVDHSVVARWIGDLMQNFLVERIVES